MIKNTIEIRLKIPLSSGNTSAAQNFGKADLMWSKI